jgi:hypothetical protein
MAAEYSYRYALRSRYQRAAPYFSRGAWEVLPGDPLIFRLAANHAGRIPFQHEPTKSVGFRTNAEGFRDRERARAGSSAFRVIALGDSYTFGWAIEQDEAYPQRTEALLRSAGYEVEVLNLGVPGYNTEQEAHLLGRVLSRFHPGLVVLDYTMNDAEPQISVPAPPDLTYRYATSWLWEDVNDLLRTRLGRAAADSKKLVPSTDYQKGFEPDSPKWRDSRAALERMVTLSRTEGVPFLLLILPDFTQPFDSSYPFERIHQTVAGWAASFGVDCIDLLGEFRGADHRHYMVAGDGHPNALAHEKTAQVLARYVLQKLEAGTAPVRQR